MILILAVNKIDDSSKLDYIHEFYALGIGDPIPVSGAHGIGIGDLLDKRFNNHLNQHMKKNVLHHHQQLISVNTIMVNTMTRTVMPYLK